MLAAVSKRMRAVKRCTQQNSLVFYWRCRLMQVDLYDGRIMVVVVVVVVVVDSVH